LSSQNSRMSLISQRDREVSIKALQYYYNKLEKDAFDNPTKRKDIQKEKNEVITLINWVKLEHFKYNKL